jgi:hypothetical protein
MLLQAMDVFTLEILPNPELYPSGFDSLKMLFKSKLNELKYL